MKDAEIEIASLQGYVFDLKQRVPYYIPIKNDIIDCRLADYINSYPDREKLKMMFMRESDGNYNFGSQRVSIKDEAGNMYIQQGNGYVSLGQFLDHHTPLDRGMNHSPVRMSHPSMGMQAHPGQMMS